MDNQNLSAKKCIPCEGGDFPPLTFEQAKDIMEHVPGWVLSQDGKSISRTIRFTNFMTALDFANEIGKIAEEEGHHPDLQVSWGKLVATFTTHAIGGLSENDFIMASKINDLLTPDGA